MIKGAILLGILAISLPLHAGAVPGTVEIDVDGSSYSIQYDVHNMVILQVGSNPDTPTLDFDVEVYDPSGTLELELEEALLDAVSAEGAKVILAIVDGGKIIEAKETETSEQSRIVRFELEGGTSVVDVLVVGQEAGTSEPDPAPEPVTEPAPEPAAEPVAEPEPVVEPVAEPEPEPVVEPVAEPEPEPVVEPVAEPEPEPVVEPVAEPEPEPVVEPVAEPEPEPVVEPVAEPEPTGDAQAPAGGDQQNLSCEPGTVLQDGTCVEEQTSASHASQLLIGAVGAGTIAAVAIILLYLIGTRDRRKKSQVLDS